jgi:cytochrome P450 family 4
MSDLANLKYLERCIKESMRLYPSVAFIERKIFEDAKIGKKLFFIAIVFSFYY